MEYSQNIINQANKAIANKSPLSFEAICAFLQKKEDGQAKKDANFSTLSKAFYGTKYNSYVLTDEAAQLINR
jgi:hypothetical protein